MKGEFKNLPSGWSRYELGEICKISSSKFDPTKSNDVKKCIELEHLSQKTGQILYGKLARICKNFVKPNLMAFAHLKFGFCEVKRL
jgi:hypothetical protein